MRNILLAAAGRSDWRKKIIIDLDIVSNTVINKVDGNIATLPSGLMFTDTPEGRVAVFNSAVFGGIQFPHDEKYAPGTGDFTVEALIDVDGIYREPVSAADIVPIMTWGTWGAPGQTMNMDFFYNHQNSGTMRLGQYVNGVGNYVGINGTGLINQTKYIHMAAQRRNGVVYLYMDGVLIGTYPYTVDLTDLIEGPFRIMARRGGGDGSVWWRFIGKLRGFRFTHAAIYNGNSFTPPVNF